MQEIININRSKIIFWIESYNIIMPILCNNILSFSRNSAIDELIIVNIGCYQMITILWVNKNSIGGSKYCIYNITCYHFSNFYRQYLLILQYYLIRNTKKIFTTKKVQNNLMVRTSSWYRHQ